MSRIIRMNRRFQRLSRSEAGMTLLELIIACSILLILSSAALPIAKYTVIRQKETELRRDLREMKDAIDRYKDAADRNQIRVEIGSEGYPPDLETLVKGVQLGASSDRKIRFLRKIPVDPMTGRAECFRRLFEINRHGTGWDEIFGLVVGIRIRHEDTFAESDWKTVAEEPQSPAACSGIHAHRVDDRDFDHHDPGRHRGGAIPKIGTARAGSDAETGSSGHASVHRQLHARQAGRAAIPR